MWTVVIAVLAGLLGPCSCTAPGNRNVLMIVADDGGFEMQVRASGRAGVCLFKLEWAESPGNYVASLWVYSVMLYVAAMFCVAGSVLWCVFSVSVC